MKKWIFFMLLLVFIQPSFAQTTYKYVIIPTRFADISSGFNPYGVCSSLQKIFNEKGIRTEFESDDRPDDYCEALNIELEKTSSMFKNKLKVILKDCQNRIIWSNEGTGQSKDFHDGYAEALTDALSGLKELPENITAVQVNRQPAQVAETKVPDVIESGENEKIYKPKNLYYNDTYFVDFVDGDNGNKELVIINGKLLGYEKQQKIATLIPSGTKDNYTIEWITPQGETLHGTANAEETKLSIVLSSDDKPVVINLEKQ